MIDEHCFAIGQTVRPWPNDKTLLVKPFKFALQQMFDRLATSQNIAVQHFGTTKLLLMRKQERVVARCRNVARC